MVRAMEWENEPEPVPVYVNEAEISLPHLKIIHLQGTVSVNADKMGNKARSSEEH